MKQYIIAIDLGGTSAKCAIINIIKKGIKEFNVPTIVSTQANSNKILKSLKKVIDEELIKNDIKLEEVLTIGLTVPGVYNNKTGMVKLAPNINWKEYPIIEKAKKIWPKQKIICLNDADAAIFGQYSKTHEENMVLYVLGTGVGGASISNGKIPYDKDGNSTGEFGHRSEEYSNKKYSEITCNCGLVGCLETVVSASAINRTINQYILNNSNSFLAKFKSNNNWQKLLTTIELNQFVVDAAINSAEFSEFKNILKPILAKFADHIKTLHKNFENHVFYLAGGGSKLDARFLSLLEKEIANNKIKVNIAKNYDKLGLEGIIDYALELSDIKVEVNESFNPKLINQTLLPETSDTRNSFCNIL